MLKSCLFFLLLTSSAFASTGEKIPLAEAPWNVSLRSADHTHGCGAVLIAPRWILTAGHCLDWLDPDQPVREQLTAWAGSENLKKLSALPPIKAVHLAPGFSHEIRKVKILKFVVGTYEKGKNDLGLIELEKDAVISPKDSDRQRPTAALRPIPLATEMPEKGASLFYSGWGDAPKKLFLSRTSDGVSVHLRGFSETYSGDDETIRELEIAGGYSSEIRKLREQKELMMIFSENTICQGDSGSGLAIRGEKGEAKLLGLVTAGEDGCSLSGRKQSTFTRIAPFLRWIHQKIGTYELVQFENADFRDTNFSELARRVGANSHSLKPYLCDGRTENELLPELIRGNPAGDSLRVILKDGKSFYVYRDGTFLSESGSPVASLNDSFAEAVAQSLRSLEKTPSGKVLLSRLQHSPYPLKIKQGGPRFAPENDDGVAFRGLEMAQAFQYFQTLRRADYDSMPFTHIGAGGYILFPPNFKAEFIESDGEKRLVTPTVILAHEMYHAFDSIRGFLDRRFIYGKEFEDLEVGEFRAVRFENQIRKETGLRYRKFYGDGSSKAGVLDAKGKPIVVASPCLVHIPLK